MTHSILTMVAALILLTFTAVSPARADAPDSLKVHQAASDSVRVGESTRQAGRDKFIDEDGDGICDGRAAGVGLRQRSGRPSGKPEAAGQNRRRGGRK